MNKLEANISLFIITFFCATQYAFLSGVPDSISDFAFLCITNLIGFLLVFSLFFSELFRLDKKQILQSLLMSGLLLAFNVFLLLGASGVGATVSSCVLSSYFIFIPILSFVFFKQKPDKNSIIGSIIVLVGLFFMMNADIYGLMNLNILYLIIGDIFFATYILVAGKYTEGSNPAILATGQLFFTFVLSLICWIGESAITSQPMVLPSDASFWGSVIFVSFFIRSLYTVVQINAQRYISPLNTSLIFSTEIIMTMTISPVLAILFGTEPESITTFKALGACIMVLGILSADFSVTDAIKRRFFHGKKQ